MQKQTYKKAFMHKIHHQFRTVKLNDKQARHYILQNTHLTEPQRINSSREGRHDAANDSVTTKSWQTRPKRLVTTTLASIFIFWCTPFVWCMRFYSRALSFSHSHTTTNDNNGHFYGAWSLAQCAVQKAAEKCINTYSGQNKKVSGHTTANHARIYIQQFQ